MRDDEELAAEVFAAADAAALKPRGRQTVAEATSRAGLEGNCAAAAARDVSEHARIES